MNDLILEDINYDFDKSSMELLEDVERGERVYMLKGTFARANYANLNKRVYPISVLGEAYNLVKEDMRQGKMLVGEAEHPCLIDSNFDVLTKSGWKKFLDLKEKESILTFDENNNIEYQVINEIINTPYSGKAYKFSARAIDSSFTPDHRFYLEDRNGKREIATAKEIFTNRTKYSHSKIIKNGFWKGNGKTIVTIPGTEKNPDPLELEAMSFFGFMGIYLSEGSIRHTRKGSTEICISQNYGEKSKKIELLLEDLGYEAKQYISKKSLNKHITFSFNDERLNKYLRSFGNKYQKFIPEGLKEYDSIYLNELIEWFILGDRRTKTTSKYTNIFSVSKKLIEDLHECLIKIGGSGNWRELNVTKDYIFAGRTIKAENKKTLYQLNISKSSGVYLDKRQLKIEEIDYIGNIYCLKVNNGNFYMKQNCKSFLTGNSGAKVNLERIACYFPELTFNESTGELSGIAKPASTPMGQIVKGLMRDGIKVGFSTRASGNVKPYHGNLGESLVEVQPGLRLLAIDAVMNPSAACFPKAIIESVQESKLFFMSGVANFKTLIDTNFLGK